MLEELLHVVDKIDEDDDVRVAVFTGSGRAFCAGADLGGGDESFDSSTDRSVREHRDGGGLLTLRLFNAKKPLIAAINGPAVGVGVTMTLPMDIRIASNNARFGFVFARRGIVPEACSSWFLPRVVGISKAMEWVMTGRVFSALEAEAGRLVSEVVEPDDLLPRARELALECARNTSAVSVCLSRQMLWKLLGSSHPMEAHRLDSRGVYEMGRSPDAREGVASFLEKRDADFLMKVSEDLPDYYPWWDEPLFSE
jgi:enoyl-CoA hydratase/carnithine racemase